MNAADAPRPERTGPECQLCFILDPGSASPWYDVHLLERDETVVVPGLGPQAEGYVLLVPRAHVMSCAALSARAIAALATIKDEVVAAVEEVYGPSVVFEHGASSDSSRGGSCIDHAHLHCLPAQGDVAAALREAQRLEPIGGLAKLRERFPMSSYVYVEGPDRQAYAGPVGQLPGQHLRRVVAEQLGVPDEWDYDAFPQYERMRRTIETLGPRLGGRHRA